MLKVNIDFTEKTRKIFLIAIFFKHTDKETFDFKPFETEGEKEEKLTTNSTYWLTTTTTAAAEITNAIHETSQTVSQNLKKVQFRL